MFDMPITRAIKLVAILPILLGALPLAAQTTRPVFPLPDEPVTRPATRPNPLATPLGAVEHLFKLIKAEDYASIRGVNLQQVTLSEIRQKYALAVQQYRAGSTVAILDSQKIDTVASVLCQLTNAGGEQVSVFSLIVVRRFDDWKVEFGQLNLLRLTPGEREQLTKLLEWNVKRLAELRSTTQPATAPAPK